MQGSCQPGLLVSISPVSTAATSQRGRGEMSLSEHGVVTQHCC